LKSKLNQSDELLRLTTDRVYHYEVLTLDLEKRILHHDGIKSDAQCLTKSMLIEFDLLFNLQKKSA
jgi:hypothetical protein